LPNTNKYDLLIAKPWVYHTAFWLSYYVFGALISFTIHQIHDPRFYWQLLTMMPPDMLLVYINLYWLAPVLLLKRRYLLYFISLLICISLISLLNIFLHHLYGLAGSTVYAAVGDFNSRNFAGQVMNSIYLLGLATGLKFLKDWMWQQQRLQEKERQQVATELDFLKSQVHPHFFFNTLNNLYALTLQKSDLAPEVVLKLSDLMSYMLYGTAAPLVPLEKEIANLENYIALEKLRFDSRLSLSFEKEGLAHPPSELAYSPPGPHPSPPGLHPPLPEERPGQADTIRIPPLILLAFVENSFKHGMNHTIGEGRITISLKVLPGELWFSVENPAETPAAATANLNGSTMGSDTAEKNGIGLKNVIRRLDLLYGTRYRLDLSGTEHTFHVTLKIPLS
jgi:two-component system LytT family sensor kinase